MGGDRRSWPYDGSKIATSAKLPKAEYIAKSPMERDPDAIQQIDYQIYDFSAEKSTDVALR